jgi:DNA-binding ferritin-like protein (Dps family)
VVPKNQRGYAWEPSEAGEFLDDLELESGSGRGLFLGTFIFNIADEAHDNIKIVDGQQRMTTIFLLLIGCRMLAKTLKADGIAQETQKRITVTDPTTAKSKGPLLIASESINDVFAMMAASDWNGSMPPKIGLKSVKLQNRRIKPVYEFFQRLIQDFDQERLSKLLESVYKIRVIRIDIDGDEEAFNIFERTNARGMDLEVSDLLKNYLYQQQVPELDDKWSEILRNSDGTILKMLKYFFVSRKGYINKSELYPRLKVHCREVGGAVAFVEELRQFSTFYNIARKEENSIAIKNYFDSIGCKAIASDADKYQHIHIALQALRLFKVSQTYPVIFAAIASLIRTGGANNKADSKILIRLLDAMEKYHFVNNAVCDRVGNEVEKLYASFCEKFCKTQDLEKTTNELISSLRKQLASEEEFSSRFCQITYSSDTVPLIAYTFDRLSNFNVAPGERVPIFDPQTGVARYNHNIEHFLPQKPDQETVIDSGTRQALDSIGNLLAISFRANSSLGNLPPNKKIQKLKGDLSKKVQNLHYVREFIDKYGDKAESWNEEAIIKRGLDMATEAYRQVWKIS